jgi:hypothetical protein
MSLFSSALALHVITAILGVGPVAVMAVVSSRRPAAGETTTDRRELLGALCRWVSSALVVMLLSGLLIEVGAGGGFHRTRWYRASVLLLLVIGVINGLTRRKLRKTDAASAAEAMRFAARASQMMCALVATITLLMTLRPG